MAKIINDKQLEHYIECGKPLLFNETGWESSHSEIAKNYWTSDQVDLLRKFGYATKFRGHSVEALIEAGVLKLKE